MNSKEDRKAAERWETCYHEAGHAVITAHYDSQHGGDLTEVTKKIVIFKEPTDYNDSGHKAGGYYQPYFHVDINLPTQDLLDVYLAGFYGECLNPHRENKSLTASQDENPHGDVQTAERLCKRISGDPMGALLEAKMRLEKLMFFPGVAESIHDVAKVCFALTEKNEIVPGEIVDEVIYGAVNHCWGHDPHSIFERSYYLIDTIGIRKYRKLFPDLEQKCVEIKKGYEAV